MSRLANKTILIIGGTSGIGAELVRQLEAENASVITASRQETAKHGGTHIF